MKVEQDHETIRCLTREDGTMVDNEDEIMDKLGTSYSEIYVKDAQVELFAE